MTDAAPRPRRKIVRRALLLLVIAGAVWFYEQNAFKMAARADARHRGVMDLYVEREWPLQLYKEPLQHARDPRAAEAVVKDADSVAYILAQADRGAALQQVFYLRLRQGPRFWRRQISVVYDAHPAHRIFAGKDLPTPGRRISRDSALAWYDEQSSLRELWHAMHADSLQGLVNGLMRLEGTFRDMGWGWSFSSDSLLPRLMAYQSALHRFGDAGVEALVDCLGDARPSASRIDGGPSAGKPVPRGAVCHHLLNDVVKLYVPPGEQVNDTVAWVGDLGATADSARLAAGERQWRAMLAAGRVRYVRGPD